jgi:Xaa-Pro aminopeptidase
MSADRYLARRTKLVASLKKAGCDLLVVTYDTNVRYLTGFTGDSTVLLVGRERTIAVSDGRYLTQLAEECPGLEVIIRPVSQGLVTAVADLIGKLESRRIGFEASHMSVETHSKLATAATTATLVPTDGLVEALRQVKDAGEISEIREAVRLAERAFTAMRAQLRGEQTERELAHNLEHTIRGLGGEGAAFPPIIAAGDRAALPHYRPGPIRVDSADLLLIDWGARGPGGYRSDLTRVLATSKLSTKLERVYGVVLKAQLAGIAAIRPGVSGKEVDQATRSVIEKAGFGKAYTHSTGHGIGLDIHEAPRLGPSVDVTLQPGMVITVEPGIYLPGWGGVRIEDDVLVTRDGHEVLTSVPKELDDIRVV